MPATDSTTTRQQKRKVVTALRNHGIIVTRQAWDMLYLADLREMLRFAERAEERDDT